MNTRKLTAGEITLAKKIFKDSIDYSQVRIHNDKYAFFQPSFSGMTPAGEIYIADIYKNNYAAANSYLKSFFIHEMVHVWQYQLKILNPVTAAIGESIKYFFDYDKAYMYTLESGKDILDYNIEQQAAIIEDYYRITYAKIKPFEGHMQNNTSETNKNNLFNKVLSLFITNPKYAQHHIICKRKKYGNPGTRNIICNRVKIND